jgi:hypothetical protein
MIYVLTDDVECFLNDNKHLNKIVFVDKINIPIEKGSIFISCQFYYNMIDKNFDDLENYYFKRSRIEKFGFIDLMKTKGKN